MIRSVYHIQANPSLLSLLVLLASIFPVEINIFFPQQQNGGAADEPSDQRMIPPDSSFCYSIIYASALEVGFL